MKTKKEILKENETLHKKVKELEQKTESLQDSRFGLPHYLRPGYAKDFPSPVRAVRSASEEESYMCERYGAAWHGWRD